MTFHFLLISKPYLLLQDTMMMKSGIGGAIVTTRRTVVEAGTRSGASVGGMRTLMIGECCGQLLRSCPCIAKWWVR